MQVMKYTRNALRSLIREAIESDKILPERPWSVEVTFSLSGGTASDSEGEGPDGFALLMSSDSVEARIVVDTYWNPQGGDKSGNSLRIEVDGSTVADSYIPVKMDDGKKQRLIVSSSPVANVIVVSHAVDEKQLPIAYLVTKSPFVTAEDIDFSIDPLGNGEVDAEITGHVNL